MTRDQVHAIIHKIAGGESIGTKQRDALAAAPFGRIDQSLADAIGYGGDDLNGAASFALKVDQRRRELHEKLAAIVGGKLPDLADRDALLSQVRMSRGTIPLALLATLGLAETAPWAIVAEALERKFNMKKKVA